MQEQRPSSDREETPGRRSMRRLRLYNGMAVLFTAMGAMGALAVLEAVLPAERGTLIGDAFEAFKLIAVTVLGYVFGADRTGTGTGGEG